MNGEEMKLEPLGCPFCGKVPKVLPQRPEIEGDAWGAVRCMNKRCVAHDSRFGGVTVRDGALINDERGSSAYKAAATRRWNTRAPINRPSPEAGESGLVERHISHEEWRGIQITSYRWKSPIPTELQGSKWQWAYASHWSTKPDAERLLPFGPVSELVARLQAELAEARKERDGEKDARRSLSMLAADEVDTAIALRDLLFRARWYVNDALEAHEHSDGRDLLREIDAALPVQALAALSPAKDKDPTHD